MISHYKLQNNPELPGVLYSNEEFLLLICGEGVQMATEMTAFVLGMFHEKIKSIINLGIAGSLSADFKKFECVNIRTIYHSQKEELQFKSFSAAGQNSNIDLITCDQRVLNSTQLEKLSPFGQLVDREAWGIASVAQKFGRPFFCSKIISDQVGTENDVCQRVKEERDYWSTEILKCYQSTYSGQKNSCQNHPLQLPIKMTVAQERIIYKLMTSIAALENIDRDQIVDQWPERDKLRDQNLRAKTVTNEFIEYLQKRHDPTTFKGRQTIERLLRPFLDGPIRINFDNDLEKMGLSIQHEIKENKDIQEYINILNSLPIDKVLAVQRGDDV